MLLAANYTFLTGISIVIISDNHNCKLFFPSSLGFTGGELDENECRDDIQLHKDEVNSRKTITVEIVSNDVFLFNKGLFLFLRKPYCDTMCLRACGMCGCPKKGLSAKLGRRYSRYIYSAIIYLFCIFWFFKQKKTPKNMYFISQYS